jgi:hypothetical protein
MKSLIAIVSLWVFQQVHSQDTDTCWIDIPQNLTEVCDMSYGKSYEFYTKTNCEVDSFQIYIFNRWGEILFENQDINHYWNAIDQKDGVYVWKIKVLYSSGIRKEAHGHFNLFK